MGRGRKRRRLARSPQSRSPTPSPSRRRKLGKETATEVTSRVDTEGKRVETEQAEGVERETGDDTNRRESSGEAEAKRGVRRVMPSIQKFAVEKGWSADPDELQKFAVENLKNPGLANLVVDAILFELLHDKLQFLFCHFCGCYFEDGDSFTMHLKEHLPLISQCHAWPLSYKREQESTFIIETLSKMVWKPINVRRAIQQLHMLYLDSELEGTMCSSGGGLVLPVEVKWPFVDDDPQRSKLLIDLEQELKVLASNETGLSLLTSGSLQRMIVVASWHMLIHLPARDHMLPFTLRLASSPLSFCFLGRESLGHFVRIARRMRQLVQNEDRDCTVWNEGPGKLSEKDSPCFIISLRPPDNFYFSLKPAHDHSQSITSWLCEKPFDILCDGPLQPSVPAPSFLTHLSVLSGACHQLMEIMSERVAFFNGSEVLSVAPEKMYYSTEREWLHKALINKTDSLTLRVVELFCVLESWEFKVRRLCTFDFQEFILPLLQRIFQQSCNSLSSELVCPSDRKYSTGGSESWTMETNNAGFFLCVDVREIMQEINDWQMRRHFRSGIGHVRFCKTWRYWYCCREKFGDKTSHMKHMENEHKFGLFFGEQIGLVPRAPNKHEIDRLLGLDWMTQDGPLKTLLHNEGDHAETCSILTTMKHLLYSVIEEKPLVFSASSHLLHLAEFGRSEFLKNLSDKKKLVVAMEIDELSQLTFSMFDIRCLRRILDLLETLCNRCNHPQMQVLGSNDVFGVASCGIIFVDGILQVDPAEFHEKFSQVEEAVDEEERNETLAKIEAHLDSEQERLMELFDNKRQVLKMLDVGFALDRMLRRESDCIGTLRRMYEKVESMDASAKTSSQHCLISLVLRESSSSAIEETLENEKYKLLSQLGSMDVEIMQVVAQINEMKRKMSDLCMCDYSNDILPFVGAFLKPRIKLDGDFSSWASNKLQEVLCSIDRFNVSNEPAYFRITSVSTGKVLVNLPACKWGVRFDYRGMTLYFEASGCFCYKGDESMAISILKDCQIGLLAKQMT